jgi:hypothetical protein
MIRFAEFDDVLFVTEKMRAKDHEEIFATRTGYDPVAIANEVMFAGEHKGVAFIAYNSDEQPVCVFGGYQKWQGVWDMFMFATDEFQTVAIEVTKFMKQRLIKMILATGAHRAECMSLATHKEAHQWLEFFGFSDEGVRRCWGKNKEDFICFGWLRKAAT